MSNEITSLKQELKDLSDKLQKVEEEKHSNISDNFTLNRKLHELQTEKENAMQTLKGELNSRSLSNIVIFIQQILM